MEVQARRWLVEKQDAGSALILTVCELREDSRKMHELLFAAGQRGDHAIGQIVKAKLREGSIHQRFAFAIVLIPDAHADHVGDPEREGNADVL